jgi:glycine oxidase
VRVVVVGAGIIGCAVAFECARRGARVQVLDPRPPGRGATHASAGILAPFIEGHIPELRALGVQGMAAYEPFLASLRKATDHPIELGRKGTLQCAFDDERARDLDELAKLLAESDVEHRRMDGAAARALEPRLSQRVIAALEIPGHGYVAPDGLVAALVDGATRLGAVFSVARVTSLPAGDTARVETEAGTMDADAVVLASGSWLSELPTSSDSSHQPPSTDRTDRERPAAIRPIRGQLLHLQSCIPVVRVLWGPGCYIVPRRDGTVLVGATVEDVGFDERATLGGVRSLSDAASALVPGLDSAVFKEVRVGLRPATSDELPIIGPSATMRQVFYAAGHYRNGVLLAPLTAGLVADLVLDGRAAPELAATRPARFGL